MSNRISEEAVIATWDAGQGLSVVEASSGEGQSSLATHVDLNHLLMAKDPQAAVQAVDRRDLYLALVHAGPEDALEIMPYLSKEQFIAIIDYEGWHEHQLSIHKVIRWLDIYKHLGVDQMFRRFKDLDEEYQTALLGPYIDIADEEEYEVMSQDLQDQYRMLPCNTLWYRVKGDDQMVEEFIASLLQGGLAEDLPYTYSLLSHASRLPPNEQASLLEQFRLARLEEDGFALPDESRALFDRFDGQAVYKRWRGMSDPIDCSESSLVWKSSELFIDAVLKHIESSGQFDEEAKDYLKRSVAMLANMLASACHVEPDQISQLRNLLDQCRSLVSLGLEVLSNGRVEIAATILFEERPKTVFQFALSLVDTIRLSALDALCDRESPGVDRIKTAYSQRRFGAVLWNIDRELLDCLGFENTEMLKGLFNRLPMFAEEFVADGQVSRSRFRCVSSMADLVSLQKSVDLLRPVGRSVLEPVTESTISVH